VPANSGSKSSGPLREGPRKGMTKIPVRTMRAYMDGAIRGFVCRDGWGFCSRPANSLRVHRGERGVGLTAVRPSYRGTLVNTHVATSAWHGEPSLMRRRDRTSRSANTEHESWLSVVSVDHSPECGSLLTAATTAVRRFLSQVIRASLPAVRRGDSHIFCYRYLISASGARFVVAFAQHQDRRMWVFERFLASRAPPGRQRASFWRVFRCMDSNGFASHMTTASWSRSACYFVIELRATAMCNSVFPDTEDRYAAHWRYL
jgi:hypothetical protein